MSNLLESIVVKLLCEKLPGDKTIFEMNGKCYIPNEACQYCQEIGEYVFCNKKTYTLQPVPVRD